jgi:uncharacterized protein (DUF2132 family)
MSLPPDQPAAKIEPDAQVATTVSAPSSDCVPGQTGEAKRVHPRDPLHGIKLETIVTQLLERHGWEEMADRIPVRCFQINPSVKSSLTFLRKTPWARQRVEAWFIAEL